LNHARVDTVNLQRPIAADDNTRILLPLSGPLAALGDAIDPKDLSIAMRVYCANKVYLGIQRTSPGPANRE
jgi:hypothetical protein